MAGWDRSHGNSGNNRFIGPEARPRFSSVVYWGAADGQRRVEEDGQKR